MHYIAAVASGCAIGGLIDGRRGVVTGLVVGVVITGLYHWLNKRKEKTRRMLMLPLLGTFFFASCAQPETQPQPTQDKRARLLQLPRPSGTPTEVLKLGRILSNGTRLNITYEAYGPLPCDTARELGLSCTTGEEDPEEPAERPRKLTPAEQRDSLTPGRRIGKG